MARSLNTALRDSLIEDQPFNYAHLIKFERPTASDAPIKQKAIDYLYLTDGSHDIVFDDGSTDIEGNANGSQSYIANKVEKVGSVAETIEARATNVTLSISATALNTSLSNTRLIITAQSITAPVDLIEVGFREGDTIQLTTSSGQNSTARVRINSFSNSNLTMSVSAIDKLVSGELTDISSTGLTVEGGSPIASSGIVYDIDFVSPEVGGVITAKTSTTYAQYINREVFIYKAHISPDTGLIIGEPYVLFKGIISSGKLSEDPNRKSTLTWTITSHWGDFTRVVGRLTSDSFHRAIGTDGKPDFDALIRPAYASDFGFQHSEQALNIIAKYDEKVKDYELRESSKFFGLIKRYQQVEVTRLEEREVDLSFNLDARSLPVIYGVNKVPSIPVFVDTKNNDPSTVYVVYAICEGEVSALFDVHNDGTSAICVNKQDQDSRSPSAGADTAGMDVICTGRMDAGSVLLGKAIANPTGSITVFRFSGGTFIRDPSGQVRPATQQEIRDLNTGGDAPTLGSVTNGFGGTTTEVIDGTITNGGSGYTSAPDVTFSAPPAGTNNSTALGIAQITNGAVTNIVVTHRGFGYTSAPTISFSGGGGSSAAATAVLGTTSGLLDKMSGEFSTPIDFRYTFHSGKPFQQADELLVSQASNMKIANDYHSGKTSEYWGPAHRLLDTAYVAAEFTIGEGETTIPSLEFVVRGKGIDCFNYDFSYTRDTRYTSTLNAAGTPNFEYQVKNTDTDALLGTVSIADKYQITGTNGENIDKIKFFEKPPIGNLTKFYIEEPASGAKYYLRAFDDTMLTGSPAIRLIETITGSVANGGNDGFNVTTQNETSGKSASALSLGAIFCIAEETGEPSDFLDNFSVYTYTSGQTISDLGTTGNNASDQIGKEVIIKDCIALPNTAGTDVVGKLITLNHTFLDGSVKVQQRLITAFDNTTKVARVDRPWDEDGIPFTTDTFTVFSGDKDQRVTTNPAIQLLDYLTNPRYGRGLDLDKDIDKESFFAAARDCDTQSEVTILMDTNFNTSGDTSEMVGTFYEYQGEVDTGSGFSGGTTTLHPDARFIGKVKSVEDIRIGNDTTRFKKVVFTDVYGKLGNRYFDWKGYRTGALYYDENGNLDKVTSAESTNYKERINNLPAVVAPTTNSGNFNLRLKKSAGAANTGAGGPTRIGVDTDKSRITFDGNPVVKNITVDASGNITEIGSGYNLYDSDDVKYWRYCGWEHQEQRWVTRHQTNHVISTSASVFDNINAMLAHFNGMLRYSNGKYALAIKGATTSSSFPTVTVNGVGHVIEDIQEDDIIGSVNLSDPGQKGTFNQISLQLIDPQNKFESRSITMLNSNYLKEDKRIPKKGDVRIPGVTNFFNARMNAKQILDQSRLGLKATFTIGPRGALLHAGDLIRLTYSRFGFSSKLFRITNLNINENCLVQITAEEHDDNTFLIETDLPSAITQDDLSFSPFKAPDAPSNLSATQNARGGIDLTWTNTTRFNAAVFTVQIWRSTSNNLSNAVLVGNSKSDRFTDPITGDGTSTFYYWIRYQVLQPGNNRIAPKELFSAYFPTSATGGVVGVSDGAMDGTFINFTNDNVSIVANAAGTPTSFDNSGTTITVFIGSTQLTYDDSSPFADSTFRVTASTASGVTKGSESTTSNSFSLANISAMPGDTGTITYTIVVKDTLGNETTYTKVQTFTKTKRGADGSPGGTGDAGDDAGRVVTGYIYWIGSAGTTPTNSNLPGTTTYNFNTTLANTTFNPSLATGSNNSANWSISPPAASSTRQTTFYAPFTAIETVSSGNQTGSGSVTFGDVAQGINFTGVVTFSGTTITAPGGESLDITQIDGSKITTGRIQSADLSVVGNKDGSAFTSDGAYIQIATSGNDKAGSIASPNFRLEGDTGEVEIGKSTGTSAGQGAISLNSNDQQILIKDAGATRVIIGKLSS